jgi:hypothetical protein
VRRSLPVAALALALSILPGSALGAQPPAWEQAETEHFVFIFEPRDRAAADELLTLCEPIYQKITGFFHSYPKKVPVIIRGRVDEANGFSTFLPTHIELFITAPTDHFLGSRAESWLKILLTHELTHYVHASMDRGFFYALSRVFGADAKGAQLAFLPGWMIEGPSTYAETAFTSGGRGRSPLFEMYSKAPVEQGKLFSLEQAAYGSAFPPPGRIYVGGYLLVDFLETTYGEDAFRRIMDQYLGFPFFGPWSAIQKVTGKSASAVFADLKAYLEAKYRQDAAIPEGALVSPDRIGDWLHPQPTARGLYVYHSSQDLFPSIVRYDPATGKEKVLQAVVNDGLSFTATRDGRTIYFSSLASTWIKPFDQKITSDLFRLDTETGALTQITHDAHLWQPCVSPDGSRLVAVQGSGPYARLVSVDPATGALRVLFSRAEANVYTPAFSPDGKRLAFTFNLRGFQNIFVADYQALVPGSTAITDNRAPVEDVNARQAASVLGPDPFGEYFPSFLDNDTVLFSSDREGNLSLYRADLTSGEVARVLDDPVAVISAVPDGNSLLYSGYSSNGRCLKSVALTDLPAVPVPKDQAKDQAAGAEYPPAFTWSGASIQSRGYTDWPAPLLWLPFPTLTRTSPGSPGIELGLGAAVYGASLLGATTWFADAAWSFASQQPLAGVTITTALGPFFLNAQSTLLYRYTDTFSQTVDTSAFVTLPVTRDARFDAARALSVFVGMEHLAELDSPVAFTFADAVGPLAADWQSQLFVGSGLAWQWQRIGGPIDFDPPLAASFSLRNSTRLPVLYSPVPESSFVLGAGFTIPSLIPHQVIIMGLKATDVLGGPFSSYTDSFAVPRGFPGPDVRTVPGQAVASIDYAIPVALLDRPLEFSLAVTGLRLAFHAEGVTRWGDAFRGFTVEPFLYAGGDVSLQMAFNAIPFSIQLGAAVRIDSSAPGSFDPARDIGVYFSIGSAAMAGGARSGLTPSARGSAAPNSALLVSGR